MRIILALILTGILSSCASRMLQSPHNSSKYAPKGYQQTGTVSYLNNGADFVIEKRRNDAFKKMYQACKGKYKIISEYSKDTAPTYYSRGSASVSGGSAYGQSQTMALSSNYKYFDFKCADK